MSIVIIYHSDTDVKGSSYKKFPDGYPDIPLLPQLAEAEKHNLLREIANLCIRVKTESGNVELAKNAVSMEAYCLLFLGEP